MEFLIKRQRGMAVVMALLLVALSASAVALMLGQQESWWHQLEHDRRRAQMRWWLDAELSWARTRFRPGVAQTPLRRREQDVLLQARLEDLQARLNLNALAQSRGLIDPEQLSHYRNLLLALQLSPSLADALVAWRGLRSAEESAAPGRRQVVRSLEHWAALAQVPGYSAAVLARLEPYAVLLADEDNSVNLNSASPLLLRAMLPQLVSAQLDSVLAQRQQQPFRDVADFALRLKRPDLISRKFGVRSSWFLLHGSVQQGDWQRQIRALLRVDGERVLVHWRQDFAPQINPIRDPPTLGER